MAKKNDSYRDSYCQAPLGLRTLQGNCGPISVWMVLRQFSKRVGTARIVRACRHSKSVGCYSIGLAIGLCELGMHSVLSTDHDSSVVPAEKRLYKLAAKLEIPIEPAINLADLHQILLRYAIIVYYESSNGNGHFSPLTGLRNGNICLPYSEQGFLSIKRFEEVWNRPGFPRQSVLVRPMRPV